MVHLATAVLLALAAPAAAQTPPAPAPKRMMIEIYRIAPGQHEDFMRFIAMFDEANRRAGLPPRQLYVHSDGEGWDFMLIQPADIPADKEAALNAAYEELKTPSGANFFVSIRKFVAEHSDNIVSGPTTAADWLKSLEDARARGR
jgi:hypothetical protein